jgi:hypothetical protein
MRGQMLKAKVAELFSHRGGEAVAGELEAARTELVAARERGDAQGEANVQAEWRARLRRLLQDTPEAAPPLAELVARYAPQVPQAAATTEIHNNTFQAPVAVNTGSGDQTNTFGTHAS